MRLQVFTHHIPERNNLLTSFALLDESMKFSYEWHPSQIIFPPGSVAEELLKFHVLWNRANDAFNEKLDSGQIPLIRSNCFLLSIYRQRNPVNIKKKNPSRSRGLISVFGPRVPACSGKRSMGFSRLGKLPTFPLVSSRNLKIQRCKHPLIPSDVFHSYFNSCFLLLQTLCSIRRDFRYLQLYISSSSNWWNFHRNLLLPRRRKTWIMCISTPFSTTQGQGN